MIDAKRYKDQRPSLVVEGGFIRPRVEKLIVGRREQTKLVDGMLRQIDIVQQVVPEVEVRGVLCFIKADLPLFGGWFEVRRGRVCWPKRLAAKISTASSGRLIDVDTTVRALEERLFSA
ncbi:hypothetical protein AX769_11325 [Frondihabitans sp. PAMC 28766]|nr:hypothetical protein AX769_11325 [Frondihabitans sp. PAMC 28766]